MSAAWGSQEIGRIGAVPPIPTGLPLMGDGIMYISAMDRAWAINARTGEQKWSYFFRARGGHHNNGSRGMGMYGRWHYCETPESVLVSLDPDTGKESFH